MSYATLEASACDAAPSEIYDFIIGTDHYRYNNSTQLVTWSAFDFESEIMTRGAIEYFTSFADLANASFDITVPDTNSFVNLFNDVPIDDDVYVNIYRANDSSDFVAYFKGIVDSIRFADDKAHIKVISRLAKLLRIGGQVRFQRLCPLCLYRGRCKVEKSVYRVTGKVTSVSTLNITSATFGGYADQWFRGGWIECNGYSRMILSHVANVVTISDRIPGLVADMNFVAYPGCDHTIASCHGKYNNRLNYGGHRFLPVKNPMAGDPII